MVPKIKYNGKFLNLKLLIAPNRNKDCDVFSVDEYKTTRLCSNEQCSRPNDLPKCQNVVKCLAQKYYSSSHSGQGPGASVI